MKRSTVAALGAALAVTAGAVVPGGTAQATPLFVGSYTAVITSFTVDPATRAPVARPDEVNPWIVSSTCAISGCIANVISNSLHRIDMEFDGTKWRYLAMPQTGSCGGAVVPARSAAMTLAPNNDGTLSGTRTSTVDCGGAAVEVSEPVRITPDRHIAASGPNGFVAVP